MKKGDNIILNGTDYDVVDFTVLDNGWYDAILEKPHIQGVLFYAKIRAI